MLRELHIRNFSIIDDTSVSFDEGFNVLTGETGAGKSIIVSALSLTLGERASGDCVRSGAKEAVVEAFFDVPSTAMKASTLQYLEDSGIDASDGLVLKRIVSPQGRSRAYINGSMVNVQTLADISRDIIDVHGQYEHQSLLSPDKQLDLIDAYAGLVPEREDLSRTYASLLRLNQQISDLQNREKERAQRLDILDYQVREIDAAGLKPGEEETLAKAEKILGSAGRLAELAHGAYDLLYASDTASLTSLQGVLDRLREISAIDSRAREALQAAGEALPLLEEAAYFLRDYRDEIEFSPEQLDQVQVRLELLKGLKRKYGGSVEAILSHRD
ncbi:MAG: AAA family ATPase, partial [Nitrospiraceae bacterium]